MLEVILVQGFYPLKINQFPNGVRLKLQYKLSLRLATTPVFKIAADSLTTLASDFSQKKQKM